MLTASAVMGKTANGLPHGGRVSLDAGPFCVCGIQWWWDVAYLPNWERNCEDDQRRALNLKIVVYLGSLNQRRRGYKMTLHLRFNCMGIKSIVCAGWPSFRLRGPMACFKQNWVIVNRNDYNDLVPRP